MAGASTKAVVEAPFINQMEPWIGAEEKQAVVAYLDAGGWLTEFQRTREFERAIADYVGARYCSVVSNGTVSLYIALVGLGIGPGDEVLVPDYTMIASANAVKLAGATPVFVDVLRDNLCMDMELAQKALTKKTKAVMYVSLNGRSGDMTQVRSFCDGHGVELIEDAAQSLGSFFGAKHLGTFGRVGSFSFSAPKVITTGQGGALVTDDEEIYNQILKIRDFGRRTSGVDYHEVVGYNFKFTDLQAVIGIEQMKKVPWRAARKKEIFSLYRTELAGVSQVEFLATDLGNTSPWFIDILVPDTEGLRCYLKQQGIGSRLFYPAIHSQPAYMVAGSYPCAEHASAHGLWLPSSSFLTDEDIRRVCAAIRDHYCG
jgi:perosamine synthetase